MLNYWCLTFATFKTLNFIAANLNWLVLVGNPDGRWAYSYIYRRTFNNRGLNYK